MMSLETYDGPPEIDDVTPEKDDEAPEMDDGAPEMDDGAPEKDDGAEKNSKNYNFFCILGPYCSNFSETEITTFM